MIRKLIQSLSGLLQRIERLETRQVSAEYAVRRTQLEQNSPSGGHARPPYAFGMVPGSPGYGLPGILWVEVGTQVAAGVYNATAQMASGRGTWVADPDMPAIVIYSPDLSDLEVGAKLPVRFEGRLSDGTLLYCVLAAASSRKRMRYKSMAADYIVCREWDGSTEGQTDLAVAKPYLLRQSTPARSGFSYGYSDYVTRTCTKTADSSVENQTVVPAYVLNDEIWAAGADTGVAGVDLIDLNLDARLWMKS